MAIVMNLTYTGENGSALAFVREMEESGVAPAIRAEAGNLRYDYFQSLSDPETVLLIDAWESQDFLDAQKVFPDLQCGTWGGAGEIALFGDLGVKNITKAHAVEMLLKHLDADRADTIAFGDAKVDIPLFRCCACSVCMGSGGAEAKAAADYVTGDVDRDGLFQAFRHLGLIG